ncbi:hypothetical protein DS2_15074 [Catenovulum agarivorans DS-2]|uniref:Uncharacterized protein n=1 Tax=Catenovulum agarivorans DS-2 TaxID=1328313 RepID=W7QJ33_9ALTE|nr:hypothetical protein DS2_15074 [Catenovulum agarivorans DS-2]
MHSTFAFFKTARSILDKRTVPKFGFIAADSMVHYIQVIKHTLPKGFVAVAILACCMDDGPPKY